MINQKRIQFAQALAGSGYDPAYRQGLADTVLDGTHRLQSERPYRSCPFPFPVREGEEAVPTVCFSCHST